MGNTCYLNSVLQSLAYVSPVANYFLKRLHSLSCSKRNTGMACILCMLEEHITRALDRVSGSFAPSSIVSKLRTISKTFRPGRQEDAHEFLRRLIDSCSLSQLNGAPRGFFVNLFTGKFRSRITCMVCHKNSDTFDPFLDVSLDVHGCNSLGDCLKKFTAVEVLQGRNAYNCKSCSRSVTAQKQFTLNSVPTVLTFQLKRFDILRGHTGKLHRKISFPLELDMHPFMSKEVDNYGARFSLSAVVVHQGSSLSSGHYYSYCRSPAGLWLQMNDETVSQVKAESVLQENSGAYLLIYELRDITSELQRETDSHTANKANPTEEPKVEITSPSSSEEEISLPTHSISSGRRDFPIAFRRIFSRFFPSFRNGICRKYRRLIAVYRGVIRRKLIMKCSIRPVKPRRALEMKLAINAAASQSLSLTQRTAMAKSTDTQWGSVHVDKWEDEVSMDNGAFVRAQKQLQHSSFVRSYYDMDYDKSTRLSHKPKVALGSESTCFRGADLFDHAAQYSKSDDFQRKRGKPGQVKRFP